MESWNPYLWSLLHSSQHVAMLLSSNHSLILEPSHPTWQARPWTPQQNTSTFICTPGTYNPTWRTLYWIISGMSSCYLPFIVCICFCTTRLLLNQVWYYAIDYTTERGPFNAPHWHQGTGEVTVHACVVPYHGTNVVPDHRSGLGEGNNPKEMEWTSGARHCGPAKPSAAHYFHHKKTYLDWQRG